MLHLHQNMQCQQKVAEVIMNPKSQKPLNTKATFQPISLLLIIQAVWKVVAEKTSFRKTN